MSALSVRVFSLILTLTAMVVFLHGVEISVAGAEGENPPSRPSQWRAKWIWQASSPWLIVKPGERALDFKQILPEEKNIHLSFVLGVRPVEPGFSRFAVEPKLAGLDYARGVFPTVKGDISVDWKLAGDRFTLTVNSPKETKVDLALPVEKTARVRVNDVIVWDGARFHENSAGVVAVSWDGASIQLKTERGGEYHVEALLR